MKNTFGKRVRGKREALVLLDPKFGLRQVAAESGLEPSYLSKIERGLVPPPSEGSIMRLAKAVALDPDELLALAGKVSDDVCLAIRRRPKLMAGLVRQFAKASDAVVQRATLRARRTGKR